MQSGDRPGGRLFEDLSQIAGGALGALGGVRADLEALARTQATRLIDELDLVRREEFEAAREMAAKARAEQEKLQERLAAIEARLATLESNRDSGTASDDVSPQESSHSDIET